MKIKKFIFPCICFALLSAFVFLMISAALNIKVSVSSENVKSICWHNRILPAVFRLFVIKKFSKNPFFVQVQKAGLLLLSYSKDVRADSADQAVLVHLVQSFLLCCHLESNRPLRQLCRLSLPRVNKLCPAAVAFCPKGRA